MSFQKREPKPVYNDLGTFISLEKIERAGKPYVQVVFKPTSGPMQGNEMKRGAFYDSIKSYANVLKQLREGDDVTLKVTVNESGGKKYRNLVGVELGHVAQTKQPFSGGASTGTNNNYGKVAKTDYNDRAAKGQALNLAMTVSIAQGKFDDDAYIMSLIPRMIKLGEAVQNGTNIESTASVKVAPQAAVKASPPKVEEVVFQDNDLFGDLDL